MSDHTWITEPGTQVRLDPTSVTIARKRGLAFTHVRMPLTSVRWTGIVRVHRPWLLWSAAVGLLFALALSVGTRDPWISRLVGDRDAAIERWLWRLVAAPIIAYLLTRRVRLVIGGDLDAHDVATRPHETVGIDLWGGAKHGELALAFLQKLEWLAIQRPRRPRRRSAAFRSEIGALGEPDFPRELATGANDVFKARLIQVGAAVGTLLVAFALGEVVPARETSGPAGVARPLATAATPRRPVTDDVGAKAPVSAPAPPPGPAAQPPIAKTVALAPDSFDASSAFAKQKEQHPARDAFDGKPSTAWCEAAAGRGDGEWLEARFSSPKRIRSIRLTTGWDYLSQYGDLFARNSHYSKVTITFDGGSAITRVAKSEERSLTITGIDVKASKVRFIADGVFAGKDPDLCISEIELLGEAEPGEPAIAASDPFGGTVATELAADDVGFDDVRGGAGWGDRCFLHLKAGRYRNGKAACERGLALGPKPAIAGALYYNLGLIEEKAGSREAARRYYAKSLEVRPGNAIVKKALAAVSESVSETDDDPALAPTAAAPPETIDNPF
ncbi:MAG: hypothetical protein HYV09_04160 [Deltaproteobacteria bacterium]|nr:hypothetical protein [Deltaproteobacteria bacterium]